MFIVEGCGWRGSGGFWEVILGIGVRLFLMWVMGDVVGGGK